MICKSCDTQKADASQELLGILCLSSKKAAALAAGALLWLVLCCLSWNFDNDLVILAGAVVWPLTIYLLPVIFALAGGSLIPVKSMQSASRFRSKAVSWYFLVLAILLFLVSYATCAVVIERVWMLWTARVKFGDNAITLGRSTEQIFTSCSIALVAVAGVLTQFSRPQSMVAWLARASIGLVGAASLVFIVLAKSPYVEWVAR